MRIGLHAHDKPPTEQTDGTVSIGGSHIKIVDLDTGDEVENVQSMRWGPGKAFDQELKADFEGQAEVIGNGPPPSEGGELDLRMFGGRLEPERDYLILAIPCASMADFRAAADRDEAEAAEPAEVVPLQRYTPTEDELAQLRAREAKRVRCRSCGNTGVTMKGLRCGCLDRQR